MIVFDPGHEYGLNVLDSGPTDGVIQILKFVKRDNPPEKYPGNKGSYPGTNMQEVLRALIDRVKYVNNQIDFWHNGQVLEALRKSLFFLELRAAEHRGYALEWINEVRDQDIEDIPTCHICGHTFCKIDHWKEELVGADRTVAM